MLYVEREVWIKDLGDFSKSLSAVILLPCKLDATERSMHILEMFSKDIL